MTIVKRRRIKVEMIYLLHKKRNKHKNKFSC
jgi:hypothetical protein